jgi:uncharacterized membrane protein YkvA (DUF1232 family)
VWWDAAFIGGAVLAVLWVGFLVFVVMVRPDTATLRQMPRVLPDTIRLVRRLAVDRSIPRSARLPVWGLLAYLAMPIDLVPDFLPVIGLADDAILTAIVLRRLVRVAGPDKVSQHWPGTPDGLAALRALLRLDDG